MIEIANLIVSSLILLLLVGLFIGAAVVNRRKKAAMARLSSTLKARKASGEKVSLSDLLGTARTRTYTTSGGAPDGSPTGEVEDQRPQRRR